MKKNKWVWFQCCIALLLSSTFIHAAPTPNAGMYTITVTIGPNGTVSPKGILSVQGGTNRQFIATPAPGYKVAAWLVDGAVIQTSGTRFLLSNITANHTVRVTFSNTLTLLYAGGENGRVYFSTNNGSNWSATNTAPSVNNYPVRSLFVTSDLLYTGLTNGSIYYSWTNGSVWAPMTRPDGGAINGLFVSPTTVYAATEKGNVYTTPVGTVSWTKLTSPNPGYAVTSIFVIAPTIIYAGSADGNVYLSNNAGLTWKAINGSPDGTPVTNVYLGGSKLYVGTQSGNIYQSNDIIGCGGAWTPFAQSIHSLFVNGNASKIYGGTQTGSVFSLPSNTSLGFVASTALNSIFVWE